jgi:hypothetical protein
MHVSAALSYMSRQRVRFVRRGPLMLWLLPIFLLLGLLLARVRHCAADRALSLAGIRVSHVATLPVSLRFLAGRVAYSNYIGERRRSAVST